MKKTMLKVLMAMVDVKPFYPLGNVRQRLHDLKKRNCERFGEPSGQTNICL